MNQINKSSSEIKPLEIVKLYFKAFNEGETAKMLSFLDENVAHDINQGQTEIGLKAFTVFMSHMDKCYKEQLKNIVYFISENGQQISAEYDVHGTYLTTDGKLPEARGQKYVVRAGSFFEFNNDNNNKSKISRVTTYYNLPEWINKVKA